jgi:hypothetical protein
MSALLPKADIDERDRHVRFVPKADILRCGGEPSLFDHLVGCLQEWLRDGEAKRLRSLEIDDQLEFGRLLDRQVTGLGTFEDTIDIPAASRNMSASSGPYEINPPSLAKNGK